MSKPHKRKEFEFSRAGTRAVAGFGPMPAIADAKLQRDREAKKTRQMPWIFTLDQAGHYESS